MTPSSSLDPYDLISELGFEKLSEHPKTTKSFCNLSLNIVQTSLRVTYYGLKLRVSFEPNLGMYYEILNIWNILSFKSHWIIIILRRENYYET